MQRARTRVSYCSNSVDSCSSGVSICTRRFRKCLLSRMLPEIPTQVFTCHSNTGLIAVEVVQVFEVGAHNITDFFQR